MHKYDLSIEGSEHDLFVVEQQLLKLGYKKGTYGSYNKGTKLVTCFNDRKGNYGYTDTPQLTRIELSTKNIDIIVALASMKTFDAFHEGEYVKHIVYENSGLLYKIKEITPGFINFEDNNIPHPMEHFRKATSDEIITYFKDRKMESRVVDHYLCIKEIPFNKSYTLNNKYYAYECSTYPEYFTPIYKQEVPREIALSIKNLNAPGYTNNLIDIYVHKDGTIICSAWKEKTSIAALRHLVTRVVIPGSLHIYAQTIHFGCTGGPTVSLESIKAIIQKWEEVFGKEK